MKLMNKTAVITGAGSGIGRAIALRFAAEGARIIIAELNEANGTETAHLIQAQGGAAMAVTTDVSDPASVAQLFQAIDAQGWSVDILVNNAGQGGTLTPLHQLTDEAWQAMLATHLNGTFYCSRAALNRMIPNQTGAIINIASVAGLAGMPMGASYSAAKAGIIGFTKAAGKEVARFGIRINAIAPGWVETPILDNLPGKLRDGMVGTVPLGRIGQPEEIAALALFLASEESSYVIGQVISPNGGGYA
ncbi:MAG TPA: SDR family NAD(P)-dependent oxidoreductase [Blastocatellia bacterium]|nr:SDR family NAD(P)-dependent oxidoreductase [Blastocatellia bacterium]